MTDILELFRPELLNLAGTALVLVLAILAVFGVRAFRQSETASRLMNQYAFLVNIVRDVVVRLAVTDVELVEYELEARNTNRDVRLVAAYHEIEQILVSFNITVDRNLLINVIERVLEDLKNDPEYPRIE